MEKKTKNISKIIITMFLVVVATIILNKKVPIIAEATTENLFGPDITFESIEKKDSFMPYVLYKPSTANESDSLPLILWLHGLGERGHGNLKDFKTRGLPPLFEGDNWELEGFNAYILCPQTGGYWNSGGEKENIKNLLEEIIEEYNINRNQIVISGHSMGGRGTLYMAHQLPEYFAKAVVLSGYPTDNGTCYPSVDISEINIPVRGYVGKGGEDYASISYMRNKFAPTFGIENTFEIEAYHGQVPNVAYNLDEDGNNRSDIIEWMFDDYSGPLIIGNKESSEYENIVSPTTGADTLTGIFLEPTLEFFTFLVDSVMSVFTSIMTDESIFQPVMVKIEDVPDLGEPTITHTITREELREYETASGALKLRYPRFTYSVEDIFTGKVDLLDVNFIIPSNEDEGWNQIRKVISNWYKILRMIAIIGLLLVLIYTGIKIIISSSAKEKSKYKQLIGNWFIAVILAFSMHYIMAFILVVSEQITELLSSVGGVIQVTADKTFNTNLIGFARFQLQQQKFTAQIGHLIIYTALATFTIKFTLTYLKRVLNMAFLTLIAPIVALTYPIDKMDGDAKGFKLWIREFTFNALLQPLHYILYYILVSTSLTLAITNPIYAIVAIMFISHAEKLLKKIFGFSKAKEGTVGGIAGAFATGVVTSKLINGFKSGGSSSGKSGKELSNSYLDDVDLAESEINNDTKNYDDMVNWNLRGLPINDSIYRYRKEELSSMTMNQLGKLSFQDADSKSIKSLLEMLARKRGKLFYGQTTDAEHDKLLKQISGLEALLYSRISNNENGFGGNLQYSDGNNRTNKQLVNEIRNLLTLAEDPEATEEERQENLAKASKLRKILERRMAENEFIKNRGIETINNQYGYTQGTEETNNNQNQEQRQNEDTGRKTPGVIKGVKNVIKTAAKPVWDTDKDGEENVTKLAGKILKGAAGLTAGIGLATVQAGASSTDGKYNPLEAVVTAGAVMKGVSNSGKGTKEIIQAYKEGANEGIEGATLQEYGKNWFNRDDIIHQYNREFPGQGKEMRRRAVDNYISRGITDVEDQIQAMRYAEQLKKERGLDSVDADKIAIATLQYKQQVGGNYRILFDMEKRKKYLDKQVDSYKGSASKDSIRKMHEELLENILDFDRANR